MITAKFVGSLQILGESVLTTSKRGGSFYKLRVRFDIAYRVGSLQIVVESFLTTEKYGGGLMKYSSLKSIFEEGRKVCLNFRAEYRLRVEVRRVRFDHCKAL